MFAVKRKRCSGRAGRKRGGSSTDFNDLLRCLLPKIHQVTEVAVQMQKYTQDIVKIENNWSFIFFFIKTIKSVAYSSQESVHRLARLLQLTRRWHFDGMMWLALCSVNSSSLPVSTILIRSVLPLLCSRNSINLFFVVWKIKSRRIRLAGHVARMEEGKSTFKILTGTPTGKRPLGSPRRR